MNKRGQVNIRWIAGAIAILFGLGLAIYIISSGLGGYGWGAIKESLGIASKHIEVFKEPTPEVEELEKKAETMLGYIIGAANDVKGTDHNKYNKAIQKYIQFYKGCESLTVERYKKLEQAGQTIPLKEKWEWKGYGCGAIEKGGIKFRVLNALREKYFKNPKLEISPSDLGFVSFIGISKEEVNCAITLVKAAGYAEKDEIDKYNKERRHYLSEKCGNFNIEFDRLYSLVVRWYNIIAGGDEAKGVQCVIVKRDLKNIMDYTNDYLRVFETDTAEWEDKVDFTVSNYQFLAKPDVAINKRFC